MGGSKTRNYTVLKLLLRFLPLSLGRVKKVKQQTAGSSCVKRTQRVSAKEAHTKVVHVLIDTHVPVQEDLQRILALSQLLDQSHVGLANRQEARTQLACPVFHKP